MNFVSSIRGYDANMDWEKGEGQPFTYFLYGTACSEVEINCLTGDHKVLTEHQVSFVNNVDDLPLGFFVSLNVPTAFQVCVNKSSCEIKFSHDNYIHSMIISMFIE